MFETFRSHRIPLLYEESFLQRHGDMVDFYVVCMLRHHKKDTVAQTSNEQTPGRYVYIEDYTTQLCGD